MSEIKLITYSGKTIIINKGDIISPKITVLEDNMYKCEYNGYYVKISGNVKLRYLFETFRKLIEQVEIHQ